MKKTLPVLILMSLFSSMLYADTVTIRSDEWYPFNAEPDAKDPGYMIEIAKKALEKAGHKLDYQLLDWDESVAKAEAGEIDCVVGASESEAENLLITVPFGKDDTGFFAVVDKHDWTYTGIEALEKKKIGVISGYEYDEKIDEYLASDAAKDNVYFASGDAPLDDLIDKLLKKEIDIVLETPPVFRAKIKSMGLRIVFEDIDRLNSPDTLHIACSKKSEKTPAYIKLFNAEIDEMRKSGELKDLLLGYGLRDWEEE